MTTTVRVLGGTEINGSATLITVDDVNFLVDYGMNMDKSDRESGIFEFPPIPEGVKIDYLLITHAHMDHSGGLYELMRSHYPYVVASAPTMAFAEKLIRNTYHLAPGQQITPNNRLYLAEPMKTYQIKNVKVTFVPNGHVRGGSAIVFETPDTKIMVSGDLSNLDLPTVSGFKTEDVAQTKPQILFLESTYGNQIFPPREAEERKMAEAVTETVKEVNSRRGNVLIPAFAFGRATDVAKMLANYGIHVNVDGMAIPMTETMAEKELLWGNDIPFDFHKNIHRVYNSNSLIQGKGKVVIAPSGWGVGGIVMKYLYHWLPDPNNAVFFPGPFQKHLAAELLKPETTKAFVSFMERDRRRGEKIVAAEIFKGARVEKFLLSSHADQNGLVKFAAASGAKTIVLHHGDTAPKIALKARLEKDIAGVTVKIAEEGQVFEF